MKSLKPLWVIGMCCLLSIHSSAQVPVAVHQVTPFKSALFSSLPDKFTTDINLINKLFTESSPSAIKIPFPGNKFFEGVIVEKVQKSADVTCINIRSSNFDGAFLTLSRIVHKDSSATYIGRMLSIRYGDMFMLTVENNQVSFNKIKQSLMLVE